MDREKEKPGKNKEATKHVLLRTVGELIEEEGFEKLGVNSVAARAGVSKMLIYRYFTSLDGLIAAYIRAHDYWINFNAAAPDAVGLPGFIKGMFREQIRSMRENVTLNRLSRWELSTDNKLTGELREKRETKGLELIDLVSRLTRRPEKEVASLATLLSAAVSYLVLLGENCPAYNGISLRDDTGWQQLEEGIDLIIDRWLKHPAK